MTAFLGNSPIESTNSCYEVEMAVPTQKGKRMLSAERRDPNVVSWHIHVLSLE